MLMAILLNGGLRLMTRTADRLYRLHRSWTASTHIVALRGTEARSDNDGNAETDVNRTET